MSVRAKPAATDATAELRRELEALALAARQERAMSTPATMTAPTEGYSIPTPVPSERMVWTMRADKQKWTEIGYDDAWIWDNIREALEGYTAPVLHLVDGTSLFYPRNELDPGARAQQNALEAQIATAGATIGKGVVVVVIQKWLLNERILGMRPKTPEMGRRVNANAFLQAAHNRLRPLYVDHDEARGIRPVILWVAIDIPYRVVDPIDVPKPGGAPGESWKACTLLDPDTANPDEPAERKHLFCEYDDVLLTDIYDHIRDAEDMYEEFALRRGGAPLPPMRNWVSVISLDRDVIKNTYDRDAVVAKLTQLEFPSLNIQIFSSVGEINWTTRAFQMVDDPPLRVTPPGAGRA